MRIEGSSATVDARATVELLQHYPTLEEARAAVEPYLRAWEVRATVAQEVERVAVTFAFEGADVVDRATGAPFIPPVAPIQAQGGGVRLRPMPFPDPPHGFVLSPDVEAMWNRWLGHLAGRESLPSMANFCITVLEASTGPAPSHREQRRRAADRYGFDPAVLKHLGDLASEVGAPDVRRKQHAKYPRPHTEAEEDWMRAVIKAMIRRAGEWAGDPGRTFDRLTAADFPVVPFDLD